MTSLMACRRRGARPESPAAAAPPARACLRRPRGARGLRAFADRRLDEPEERRVLLHPVDEDEAPGVLELALHGDADRTRDRGRRAPRRRGRAARANSSRRASTKGRSNSGSCRSGARRGRRRAGRGARPGSRSSRAGARSGADHEVARLVVAVDEDARPRRRCAWRAGRRCASNARAVRGESARPARLEPPLAEVIDLPAQELLVERARWRRRCSAGASRERLLRPREVARPRARRAPLFAPGARRGSSASVSSPRSSRASQPRAVSSPWTRGTSTPRAASRVAHLEERPASGRRDELLRPPRASPRRGRTSPTAELAGHATRGSSAASRRPRASARSGTGPRARSRDAARRAVAAIDSRRAARSEASTGEIEAGESIASRTPSRSNGTAGEADMRSGSQPPGPRGTTASRWPPSSDRSSSAPRRARRQLSDP